MTIPVLIEKIHKIEEDIGMTDDMKSQLYENIGKTDINDMTDEELSKLLNLLSRIERRTDIFKESENGEDR